MNKQKKTRGCAFDTIMLVLISFFVIGTAILIIFLPYNMLKKNQLMQAEIQEKGIQSRQVTITNKEIDSYIDGGGDSHDDYWIYFDGGSIESYRWYDKVDVGSVVTVYTVDGQHYKFSKDEFLHSKGEINSSLIISNSVLAIVLGIVLTLFYDHFFERRAAQLFQSKAYPAVSPKQIINATYETDYDTVNHFFLSHVLSKEKKKYTMGDNTITALILAQIISFFETTAILPVLLLIALIVWKIVRASKSKKNKVKKADQNRLISQGDYYTVTARVKSKYTRTESSGEDDITYEYVVLENNEEPILCTSLYYAVETGSLIHFFIAGNDECSNYQVVEKHPGTSQKFEFCDQIVAKTFIV